MYDHCDEATKLFWLHHAGKLLIHLIEVRITTIFALSPLILHMYSMTHITVQDGFYTRTIKLETLGDPISNEEMKEVFT